MVHSHPEKKAASVSKGPKNSRALKAREGSEIPKEPRGSPQEGPDPTEEALGSLWVISLSSASLAESQRTQIFQKPLLKVDYYKS